MIRTGISHRWLRETQRRRQEREQRENIQRLKAQWHRFNLPIQEELALHLRRFGLEAAQHATVIAERLHGALVDTIRPAEPPPASLRVEASVEEVRH
jgi:hypothetical protein